jgi:hypothetical protein
MILAGLPIWARELPNPLCTVDSWTGAARVAGKDAG